MGVVDDDLLEEALRMGGRTKRETVNEALAEYVQRRKRRHFAKLFGTIDFRPDWDYKKARRLVIVLDTSVLSAVLRRRRRGDAEEGLAARKGVALSTPDALIAAQAFNRRASLFTTGGDFPKLAALAGLKLL